MTPSDRDATGLLTRPDHFVQLVTPTGERRADPEFDRWVADVDADALARLYRDMSIVRRLDSEATALQRQGELALWPPLAGQEAAQIGSARALRDDDFVFTSYREHAVAWCRGVGPAELLTVWRGSASSGWNPSEHGIAVPQIIIGAQALHATGWAMGAAWEGSDAASVAYFGDGATSEGDVNEALVFAASFDAPVVFFCQNNQWAISEPVGLQSKQPLARRADGFGMPGVRVDGNDVLAVLAATRIALDRARRGEGPTFIEAVTYRLGPHTTADDPKRYRTDDELAEWRTRDPITRRARPAREHGRRRRRARARGRRGGGPRGRRAARRRHHDPRPRADDGLRPRVRRAEQPRGAPARPLRPLPGHVRRRGCRGIRNRRGSTMTTLTFGKAINAGLRRALAADEKVVLMGEDIGSLGGVFRVTDGLKAEFGANRVVDTPLSEAGIMGTAVGLAYRGFRPVVEIQFDGFIYPAFDQIVAQVAKLHYRSRGNVRMPITIRVPFGGGIGAAEHHSESPEAYFAHTAGLRVIACSNPADAYVMIQQAIASDDPVLFFEPKRRYHVKGEVDETASLADAKPMGVASVVTAGTDVTLVTYGALVQTARDAAIAAAEDGVSIEVIDLRSLAPVDYATVEASVRRTGRLVITHEAGQQGGVGAELAASVTERCFEFLEAAPVRVTGHDIPYPPAKLERHHLPDLDRILDGVDRVLGRPNSLSGVEA